MNSSLCPILIYLALNIPVSLENSMFMYIHLADYRFRVNMIKSHYIKNIQMNSFLHERIMKEIMHLITLGRKCTFSEWVGEGILCMTLYVYKTLPKMIITITTKADIELKHAHIFSCTHINAQVDGLLIIGIEAVCVQSTCTIFLKELISKTSVSL